VWWPGCEDYRETSKTGFDGHVLERETYCLPPTAHCLLPTAARISAVRAGCAGQSAVLREVNVQFEAKVEDGKLNGTLHAPRGEAPVTGVRAAAAE
jgi:hypothetical protein